MPRLDRLRTAVLRAWRGFVIWWVRSAVSVAGLAVFEVTAQRGQPGSPAVAAGLACGMRRWSGRAAAVIQRPGSPAF